MKEMKCVIVEKAQTPKGSNYFSLLVEKEPEKWVEAVYFGNTTPKYVVALKQYKEGFIAEIQPHTSRDKRTGKFKCRRAAIA